MELKQRPVDAAQLRLGVASDHAGLALKRSVVEQLSTRGLSFEDLGPSDETPVDYPDYAHVVCKGILEGRFNAGILICGSGQGMCITANRYPTIRATLCADEDEARLVRQHNDSNVLVLAGRKLGAEASSRILERWLTTSFEGGRHVLRLQKIERMNGGGLSDG